MGLAGYGDDRILKEFPKELWFKEYGNHVYCNTLVNYPPLLDNKKKTLRYSFYLLLRKTRRKLSIAIKNIAEAFLKLAYRNDIRYFATKPNFFNEIYLHHPPRGNNVKLPDKYYSSVAYLAQFLLEKIAIIFGKRLKEVTRCENLSVAGGVGLNIDANRNFIEKVGFKRIWIQPGSSDSGIPLGCALYGAHEILKLPRFWEMKRASLGRTYSEEDIKTAINKFKDKILFEKSPHVTKDTARYMADGKIIGWFHGGSEYGPRALGNRSIICDASRKDMKDILNIKVKHREPWRPFATSILAEHQSEWFEFDQLSPFMLLASLVKEEKKSRIPSIVHVDGTCRIQAVTRESNAKYYDLINEFKKITGLPLILNTSFNLGGDPIVETPEDALETFLKTEIDYLILEDYVIEKNDKK
ncbi:hypothetical protein CL630_02445 [bacterium]|nr:hypothetical protein [bacterium]|tara:strand:- start:45579 stop:46817 length:1239 start_codon:yes stop_codon:yes gene_type:complete